MSTSLTGVYNFAAAAGHRFQNAMAEDAAAQAMARELNRGMSAGGPGVYYNHAERCAHTAVADSTVTTSGSYAVASGRTWDAPPGPRFPRDAYRKQTIWRRRVNNILEKQRIRREARYDALLRVAAIAMGLPLAIGVLAVIWRLALYLVLQ